MNCLLKKGLETVKQAIKNDDVKNIREARENYNEAIRFFASFLISDECTDSIFKNEAKEQKVLH